MTEPLRYRGQSNSYVDIAIRGTDEHLGLGLDYAVHPQTGVGCFLVRFVVHGPGVEPTKYHNHLTYREMAKFVLPATATTGAEVFHGVRLNKLAIPVFQPAVRKRELDKFAQKFGIWPMLTEWIAEQVTADGFTVTVELQQEIQKLLVDPPTPEESVKSVIEFPDLTAPEHKALAMKQAQKPVAVDEDEDEDDGEKKDWLN